MMTDQQWYDLCKVEYEKVASDLEAQGYQRVTRSDIYKEHFTKQDRPTLVIIRHLGSSNWLTKEVEA